VRRRGFHIFYTIGSQIAVRLSALRAGRPLSPGRFLVLICPRLSRPQGHSAAGRTRSIEKSNYIGNQTRDLPACSTVPQPTTLPHAPRTTLVRFQFKTNVICLLKWSPHVMKVNLQINETEHSHSFMHKKTYSSNSECLNMQAFILKGYCDFLNSCSEIKVCLEKGCRGEEAWLDLPLKQLHTTRKRNHPALQTYNKTWAHKREYALELLFIGGGAAVFESTWWWPCRSKHVLHQ
jgi:hypothetical protein